VAHVEVVVVERGRVHGQAVEEDDGADAEVGARDDAQVLEGDGGVEGLGLEHLQADHVEEDARDGHRAHEVEIVEGLEGQVGLQLGAVGWRVVGGVVGAEGLVRGGCPGTHAWRG